MFVYVDIIDTVLVGNTKAFMLGYFSIQSKWVTSRIGILTHLIMLKLREAQFEPFQSDFVIKNKKLLRLNLVLLLPS